MESVGCVEPYPHVGTYICSTLLTPSLLPHHHIHVHASLPSALPHPLLVTGFLFCTVCCMGHWCDMHLSLQNADTPLMAAACGGHTKGRYRCMQLLLDRDAQVDHQNKVSAFLGSAQCLFLSCSLV